MKREMGNFPGGAVIGIALGLAMILLPIDQTVAQVWREGPEPVSGNPLSKDGMTPADVLARVTLLQETLEAIRWEMGKPQSKWKTAVATNAHPHEVYFQALTLFLKANRLALEITGSTGIRPDTVAPSEVRPLHVWMMVNAAYHRILTVKGDLNIPESFTELLQPPSTTPDDVIRAIVQTNRQINLLLERPFSPSDVFQQVALAIQYTAGLLAQFPGDTMISDAPSFERGKRSVDVLFRLIQCYALLESIAKQSNINILHLDRAAAERAVEQREIHPSDVYDMATLLLSDLVYLHSWVKNGDPPGTVPYPGRKLPSHVYQQAGMLLSQLTALERKVKNDPQWLNR